MKVNYEKLWGELLDFYRKRPGIEFLGADVVMRMTEERIALIKQGQNKI